MHQLGKEDVQSIDVQHRRHFGSTFQRISTAMGGISIHRVENDSQADAGPVADGGSFLVKVINDRGVGGKHGRRLLTYILDLNHHTCLLNAVCFTVSFV